MELMIMDQISEATRLFGWKMARNMSLVYKDKDDIWYQSCDLKVMDNQCLIGF